MQSHSVDQPPPTRACRLLQDELVTLGATGTKCSPFESSLRRQTLAAAAAGLTGVAAASIVVAAWLRRVEPLGPSGVFEDSTTFNVVGWAAFEAGLPIAVLFTSADGTWLGTHVRHFPPSSSDKPVVGSAAGVSVSSTIVRAFAVQHRCVRSMAAYQVL